MSSIRFDFDWQPAPGVQDPALARTWALIKICVGERCATHVLKRETRSQSDAVYGSALPVALWLVDNLPFMLDESRRSEGFRSVRKTTESERDWHDRHNLLTAREGFSLPELVIARGALGDVECDWIADPFDTKGPVRFDETGGCRVGAPELLAEAHRVVIAVLERAEGVESADVARLRARWPLVAELQRESDASARRLVARMGLDPLDEDESSPEVLEALSTAQGLGAGAFVGEVCDGMSLSGSDPAPTLEHAAAALRETRGQARTAVDRGARREGRARARSLLGTRNLPAYAAGWQLAQHVRDVILELDVDAPTSTVLASAYNRLLPSPERRRYRQEQRLLDGLACSDDGEAWSVSVDESAPPRARNFIFARGIAVSLLQDHACAVTRSANLTQRVARAFAAEFLAPAEALREQVSGDVIDSMELDALAAKFAVDARVIEHQLRNQRIATVQD